MVRSHPVPARARVTVAVNDDVGPNQDVGMEVVSDRPLVAGMGQQCSQRGRVKCRGMLV